MALFLPPSLVPSAIAPFVFKLQKESIHVAVVVLSTLPISAMVIVRSPPSPPSLRATAPMGMPWHVASSPPSLIDSRGSHSIALTIYHSEPGSCSAYS